MSLPDPARIQRVYCTGLAISAVAFALDRLAHPGTLTEAQAVGRIAVIAAVPQILCHGFAWLPWRRWFLSIPVPAEVGVIPTNLIPGAICGSRVKNDRFREPLTPPDRSVTVFSW